MSDIVLNIENATITTFAYDSGYGGYRGNIQASSGYKFKYNSITASYTDYNNRPSTGTISYGTVSNVPRRRATITCPDCNDTGVTITGETIPDYELDRITNNIPYTSVSGNIDWSTRSGVITITADSGYVITTARVTYTKYSTGYTSTVTFTISDDGKTATANVTDYDGNYVTTFNGTSEEGGGTPTLSITNNIASTSVTDDFDGVNTATISLTGNLTGYALRNVAISYTNTAGISTSVAMVVDNTGNSAAVTLTDIDPSYPLTITGEYVKSITITSNLTNCTGNAPSVSYVGDTISITLTADANTEFDTAPRLSYFDSVGVQHYDTFTVDSAKTIATLSITLGDWSGVTITAATQPVIIIGTNYGAVNVYIVDTDIIDAFAAKRFFKEVVGTGEDYTRYQFVDLGDFVVSVRRIYATIPVFAYSTIKAGSYNTAINAGTPENDVITINYGTIQATRKNNTAVDDLDEVRLFIPFFGFYEVPKNQRFKAINLTYKVNVLTGFGYAILSTENGVFDTLEVTAYDELLFKAQTDSNTVTQYGQCVNKLRGLIPYALHSWHMDNGKDLPNNDLVKDVIGNFVGYCRFDYVDAIAATGITQEEQEEIVKMLNIGVYINS